MSEYKNYIEFKGMTSLFAQTFSFSNIPEDNPVN